MKSTTKIIQLIFLAYTTTSNDQMFFNVDCLISVVFSRMFNFLFQETHRFGNTDHAKSLETFSFIGLLTEQLQSTFSNLIVSIIFATAPIYVVLFYVHQEETNV